MAELYRYQDLDPEYFNWDLLVDQVGIPVPGTLEDLHVSTEGFIYFTHHNGFVPSFDRFHDSPQTPPEYPGTTQRTTTAAAGRTCMLDYPQTNVLCQPLLTLSQTIVENINASAFDPPQNHPFQRSSSHGEVLDKVQIPQDTKVLQSVPGLVRKGPQKVKSGVRKKGLDQTLRQTICRDDTGKIRGFEMTFGPTQRSRGPFSESNRKLTAATRKEGACTKCHRGKKRCVWPDSKYESCKACVGVRLSVLRMPCFRAKIIEAALFRLQPSTDNPLHNWGFRKQVCGLEDEMVTLAPPKKLWITQDVGIESTIYVSVARFTPEPEDKTSYVWTGENGVNTMEMPHYWIINIQEARRNMSEYIQRSVYKYIELALEDSDGILRDTFAVAMRVASSGNHMVKSALGLWSASRMIEKTWRICGEDKLGLEASTDPANPWNGIVPVTPIMDMQLDQIVIRGVLMPLRTKLLQELQEKIYSYERGNWFSIFLTTFILLSNTESILAHSRRFARRYGMGGRYGYPGQYSSSEGFFHAAKILLAHFHFVSKGYLPLQLDWKSSKAVAVEKPDADQTEYMDKLKDQIKEKGRSVLDLRTKHKYETELYWCHQMFFEGWTPGQPHIEEEEEVYE